MSDTIVVQDTVIEPSSDKPVHQRRIEEFMAKAGQACPDKPTVPDEKTILLRAAIIYEEYTELLQAMGVVGHIEADSDGDAYLCRGQATFTKVGPVDMVEVADAVADGSVVLYGTASAFGIAMNPILALVDDNNLAKFAPGYSVSATGKLIKPPGHVPPDFKKALIEQGWCPPDDQGMP